MILTNSLKAKRGFTLVEVLVSMVILAIGLLGLAALQGRALKDNQDAYYYSQASLLAYEMGDRIKANKAYWNTQPDGSLNGIPDSGSAMSCASINESCLPAEMAATDLKYWEDSALKVLPSPSNAKLVEIKRSSDAPNHDICKGKTVQPPDLDPSLCLITTWARVNVRANGSLTTDMIYYFEVSPE